MKTLVVYCTRTGLTQTIAEKIAKETKADLCFVTDGKDYDGFFGYIKAAVVGLRKTLPELLPVEMKAPLQEYDRVIVCAPIWCEDVSPVARQFLLQNKDEITGDICFVITHMSALSYDAKTQALSELLGKAPKAVLSVQTKNHDYMQDTENFIKRIQEA